MAEHMTKHRRSRLSRSASAESSDVPVDLGKQTKRKLKKPKERWLLTRKTWRYMADAGRKLIPDGSQNRPEDIPKIEAYFQEVCKLEPRFLLWRKNSYPGALAFRKKRKDLRKGGSCRKASSADEIDEIKPVRPKDLPLYSSISGGRFDIQKMKYDFLNAPPPSSPRTLLKNKETYPSLPSPDEEYNSEKEEVTLINMLEKYLHISQNPGPSTSRSADFDYQDLIDKLQRHLTLSNIPRQESFSSIPVKRDVVHFEGDHVQKSLSETLSRFFSQYPTRNKIVSDLLTNRKALQSLYFDLRQSRGFRGRRDYPTSKVHLWDQSMLSNYKSRLDMNDYKKSVPPPLIEIQGESIEPIYIDEGIQTVPILEDDLIKIEEEFKKTQSEKEEEERETKGYRRRSSVDNDDVSQSVSDTIKRYLRMARKKSADSDKVDRFKRVNYDRNLRNIKAKGEITKPGDDDGLNKGCQTSDDWILTYRDLKFDEYSPLSDPESRVSSTRSSIDAGVILDSQISPTKSHHSFLSNLLHGKHSDSKSSSAGVAMQKSKSSSSVAHHGSRLMAKSIFKRSKSQSRAAQQQQPCTWTPKGTSTWTNVAGKQVTLAESTLPQLSDIERKVLQKVALAKLQALNLGVSVKIPSENIGAVVPKKRRPYLLKRKALTTGIFDTGRKDLEKGSGAGLVFGIPLSQCVENDRVSRINAGASVYGTREIIPNIEPKHIPRNSSRASFSSLIDATLRTDEKGSCESLSRERIAGSVPGLLDTISCGSNTDIIGNPEESKAVPHVVNECIRHLEAHGLQTLGIFRVSSSKKRVRQLREDFDSGKETVISNEQCPHDVATLLKEFLRDLPDPLLCRDLYTAFVQTQKIRNRRLQLEALQHLVQLLPSVNRDTLSALLSFLANVAKKSNDQTDALGELVIGNKMTSANLATVFAPNILHSVKQGSKDSCGSSDDRIDVINVIRTMIDSNRSIFTVSAELLDEIYVHMMDSHPEALEELLNKREAIAYESQDEISDGSLWSPTHTNTDASLEDALQKYQDETDSRHGMQRKTYSREECLHEAAATGGPNMAMRFRHKERIKERSLKKRREESSARRRDDDSGSSTSSLAAKMREKDGMNIYTKTRSSSLESSCSLPADDSTKTFRIGEEPIIDRRKSTPYVLDKSGIITASLTIPVQSSSLNVDDNDIPYIEDGSSCTFSVDGKHQMTVGILKSPVAPPRRRQRSMSGSDSSIASVIQPITGSISLIQQQGYDSAIGSSLTYSSPPHNTPSSLGSSIADASGICSPQSWASSPPTSPDSHNTTVNYIPDDIILPTPTKTSGPQTTMANAKENPVLQKVSYTKTSEIRRAGKPADVSRDILFRKKSIDIQKCASTPVISASDARSAKEKVNPGITSIGNDVLRSRTADFERITNTTTTTTETKTSTTTVSEKKKYTKRRYTDSRHQTRHIPDSETLDTQQTKENKSSTSVSQTVYKRRELISSVPSGSQ